MTQSIEAFTHQENLSALTRYKIRQMLDGKRVGLETLLAISGPALIASVAYIDPGNFATNIQAGAKYGYGLLWVIVLANTLAIFFQSLSAKLGIVTDQSLPELCRAHFPRHIVWPMWIGSEISAIATDLAEFLGSALGLSLLLHVPMSIGMMLTAVTTFAILHLTSRGFRPVEIVITTLVAVTGLCYLAQMFLIPINWSAATYHLLQPKIVDAEALTLSVGIIGATVMPHAIYLHSGLTKQRVPVKNNDDRGLLVKFSNWEVVIALMLAGMMNLSMVFLATAAFQHNHLNVDTFEAAFSHFKPTLGPMVALLFVISLVISGISSSAVGTMAGDMIMQGFLHVRIPSWVRRSITIIPAFILIGLGINTTQALILSQIILSLTLPIPLIALAIFTSRPDIMGEFVNGRLTKAGVFIGTAGILLLNLILIWNTVTGL